MKVCVLIQVFEIMSFRINFTTGFYDDLLNQVYRVIKFLLKLIRKYFDPYSKIVNETLKT